MSYECKSCPINMNHVNHVLVLKTYQNPNPVDAQLMDIVFNIQTIGCYRFQGSHPVCFSVSRTGAISLIS